MTLPKINPCFRCGDADTVLYGYEGWSGGMTWHVECDECHMMGPGGSKAQAVREYNARTILDSAKAGA